jgi:protein SCO1
MSLHGSLMYWLATLSLLTGQSPLADIGSAPRTALTGHDGQPFRVDSLRGKAVVVSFIFTTCNGTCPMTTRTLARVQDRLKSAGLWGRGVEFVSITLDPTRDTPEALRQYAKTYGADLSSWHFLTGSSSQVDRVIASWNMWVKRNASGVLDHPSRVFLIDPNGHVREIYNLDFLTPDSVLQDVKLVLAEAKIVGASSSEPDRKGNTR